ncbi:hypothetical protein [Tenggerimyces flavus]|uniref:DUF4386 domain-containing protein n=1 Tax=Tenggerimyces flavus TaxID=1708749 RepID=A0ABV7YF25_9ACTN|nr:hypothetical protein [Tenggerimyces flavus]MBM7789108.1 hypothetical protein [Tenggerimyces flavus]
MITTSTLGKAAGVSAVVAGLLFVSVQIGHPHLELASVSTTEWIVRNTMKVAMAALSLAGITGIYLRQVRQLGILGLVGYVLFSTAYLVMMSVAFVAGYVLPSLAGTSPAYVNDVLAMASGGTVVGDIGALAVTNLVSAVTYLAGGVIFGIAVFRAGILARWAAALLAAGTLAALAVPLVPHLVDRLIAFPTGIALVGLGISLWRSIAPQATTENAHAERLAVR